MDYTDGPDDNSGDTSSVIPPGQPGGPGYEDPTSVDVSNSPIAEPVEGYEQSVIPPGQPGGPGYEEPAGVDDGFEQSVIPPGQPDGPGYEEPAVADGSEQSVIPPGQPGGPGYEQPPMAYDDAGNPAVFGVTPNGESSTGTWWSTAAPVVECCVPLPAYEPTETSVAQGLAFIDSEAKSESLPGIDSNSDGIADFTSLDANQDGAIDTWFVDSTGSGTVDAIFYDSDGDGLPEAVTYDVDGSGNWTQPELISQSLGVIPPGQPGGPELASEGSAANPVHDYRIGAGDDVATAFVGYEPGPGANLAAVCACTSDAQAQTALARIAVTDPTPAPPAVTDVASDTQTPPPTDSGVDTAPMTVPAEWETWQPATEASPESFTDAGYSTDWGQVTPDWAESGETPFPVSEPTQPLTSLIGPGHEADVYWGYQGNTNYCGIYSVRAVLSEMYGTQVDVNEMIQRADQNGWLVRENGVVKGIYPENIEKILESYGIASHDRVGVDNAWEDLNSALASNQRVVLAIDAKEIAAQTNVGTEVPGVDWDHFVSITGIDYEKGVVIMNDSARSAGLELPLQVFKDAWADSNYRMTITDVKAPAAGGATGYAVLGTMVEARPA